MAAALYRVITTNMPGRVLEVEDAELERLTELGLIASIESVTVPADRVVITDGEIPPQPVPVGTVWFDRSMPFTP